MVVFGSGVILEVDFGYRGDIEEGVELVEDFWKMVVWFYWFFFIYVKYCLRGWKEKVFSCVIVLMVLIGVLVLLFWFFCREFKELILIIELLWIN